MKKIYDLYYSASEEMFYKDDICAKTSVDWGKFQFKILINFT